jgi:hypothetical protein
MQIESASGKITLWHVADFWGSGSLAPFKTVYKFCVSWYSQVPLLEKGDIIIDGGNSEYTDSQVRKNKY